MENAKLKILYVIPTLDRGGSEVHLIGLARALAFHGEDVHIVTLLRRGSCSPLLDGSGVTLRCLNLSGTFDFPRLFARLVPILREGKFNIVHTFLSGFDLLAAFPAALAGRPVILGARRELASWMKRRHRLFRSLGKPLLTGVVCCSEAVRAFVLREERLPPERVAVVRSGVDCERYRRTPAARTAIRSELGIPADELLFVTVANFGREKGHPVLVEAAGLLPSESAERSRFLFVGDGPLLGEVRRLVEAKGLATRILFAGSRQDIPAILSAADLFVLPSLSEGLPNALLEAMAGGLPVISTRVGGIPEAVEHGRTGLLIGPGDAGALACSMAELAADRFRREAMGRRALERAAEFSLDRMVQGYLALYRRSGSICGLAD
jgi:glycosyltransferase involved in cell wall biosynthesis